MPIKHKVVVRYRDGRMVKGHTLDFAPNKDVFHVADANDSSHVAEVSVAAVKAVFYVKDFEGDPSRSVTEDFSKERLDGITGLKLKVTFEDGEVMYGTTNGYTPARKGFFVFPVDEGSNNERVYVLSASTKSVETWR
jgi:hypothetical protein